MLQTKHFITISLLLITIFGLAACGGTQAMPTPTPTSPPTAPPQPAPADAWIEITYPPDESVIPDPVIVEGQASPSAQVVRIQIKDTNDNVLGEQVVTFSSPSDTPRGFSIQIFYTPPSQRIPGVIEAYFNESGQPLIERSVVLSPP